jgi:hypothetical protein
VVPRLLLLAFYLDQRWPWRFAVAVIALFVGSFLLLLGALVLGRNWGLIAFVPGAWFVCWLADILDQRAAVRPRSGWDPRRPGFASNVGSGGRPRATWTRGALCDRRLIRIMIARRRYGVSGVCSYRNMAPIQGRFGSLYY